jgi:predicted GNAT superfamily acetyltransferase
MEEAQVRIRRAADLNDYRACVALQKEIWGFTEPDDIAGVPMLLVANRFGGSVFVAENAAGRFVGFSFALPCWDRNRMHLWWSHMTAVIPEYRRREIGLRLKLSQRESAMAEGVDEIRWTFDPLQAMNGYFNIRKLGAVVRSYEENIYGETSSSLHAGLPTDRFVAEWRLDSQRVKDRLDVSEHSVILRDLDRMTLINPAGKKAHLRLDESPLLLEVPADINQMKTTDPQRAIEWQGGVRAASRHYFQAGYAVTDFFMLSEPRQAFYVLEKQDSGE